MFAYADRGGIAACGFGNADFSEGFTPPLCLLAETSPPQGGRGTLPPRPLLPCPLPSWPPSRDQRSRERQLINGETSGSLFPDLRLRFVREGGGGGNRFINSTATALFPSSWDKLSLGRMARTDAGPLKTVRSPIKSAWELLARDVK